MGTRWGLTLDCARPRELAEFWVAALGYEHRPAPAGFASWDEWLEHHGVPEEEWDDGAYLQDPTGAGPTLSLLKVPESKVVKNRLHMDIKAGGRELPWEERWPLVLARVAELEAAGATVLYVDEVDGRGDHVTLTDPEGNEFCVV
jgi:hypothetical protein